MPEKIYSFNVEMSCEGCSNALTKVLNNNKDKGIGDFNVDLKEQLVKISSSSLSSDEIMDIVKKTGKKVTFISEEVKN